MSKFTSILYAIDMQRNDKLHNNLNDDGETKAD